jgi:hypothetical protein
VVLIGIIVAVCFRATRSSRKEKYKKSSEFQSQSSEQGPAPLPLGYKKPVDLLQVAEQNRRIEEAEEKQRIQQQYKNNPNASYQTNQTNGYVSVPLSQVYVVAQSSPNRQNLAPGSFPAQYVDPGQQFSASYGYPGNFVILIIEMPQQAYSEQSKSSYRSPPSDFNGTRPAEIMDPSTNYRLGQQQPYHGQNHMGYNQQLAAPPRSYAQELESRSSYSSDRSNVNNGGFPRKLTQVAPPRSYAQELESKNSYASDRSDINSHGLSQKLTTATPPRSNAQELESRNSYSSDRSNVDSRALSQKLTQVAPPRSYAQELESKNSYASNKSYINSRGLSQKNPIATNIKDLPTLPAADYSKE